MNILMDTITKLVKEKGLTKQIYQYKYEMELIDNKNKLLRRLNKKITTQLHVNYESVLEFEKPIPYMHNPTFTEKEIRKHMITTIKNIINVIHELYINNHIVINYNQIDIGIECNFNDLLLSLISEKIEFNKRNDIEEVDFDYGYVENNEHRFLIKTINDTIDENELIINFKSVDCDPDADILLYISYNIDDENDDSDNHSENSYNVVHISLPITRRRNSV